MSREAGEDVGAYDVTLGDGAKAGNYAITFDADNSALSITPRPVTVAADTKARLVGQSDPIMTWLLVDGQFIGEDTLTGDLVREPGQAPRRFDIKQGTLSHPNYMITFTDGAFTIDVDERARAAINEVSAGVAKPAADRPSPTPANQTNIRTVEATSDDASQSPSNAVHTSDGRGFDGGVMQLLILDGGVRLAEHALEREGEGSLD